jgi:hypothetical protein
MKEDEKNRESGINGRGKMTTGFWWGNLSKKNYVEDLGIDWVDDIKMDGEQIDADWTYLVQGYRPVAGCCEQCSELLASIEVG